MNKYYIIVSEAVDGVSKGQKHYHTKGGYVRTYGCRLSAESCYRNKKTAQRIAKKYDEDEFFKNMKCTVEEVIL